MSIKKNLQNIHQAIRQAENNAQRLPNSVQLLAVSKTKPSDVIIRAYQKGQRHFAESYLQEALLKQKELGSYLITWHFIGPIQSNKTKQIATHFSWVHSVGRLKIAQRLSMQRPESLPPLNICIQINMSRESSKSGFSLAELDEVVEAISILPRIRLRGVMTLPKRSLSFERQRKPYRELYQAVQALNKPELNVFSFGMSGDLNAAIAEGATIVRVGTALFGARN